MTKRHPKPTAKTSGTKSRDETDGLALLDAVIAEHRRDGHQPEPEPSAEEWAATSGAHQRMLADVLANPVSRASFETATARITANVGALRELRKARALTQTALAKNLGMTQSEVSKLEQRSDVLLSTLSGYVAATGGRLRLVAEYPNAQPITIELAPAP